MAFVFTRIAANPDKRQVITEITLDASSYASGGIPVTNAQIGMLGNPDHVNCEFSTGQGFNPEWIPGTSKVIVYKSSAGAAAFTECVAADFTTAMKIRVEALGLPVV
jgi:hypothetical protein